MADASSTWSKEPLEEWNKLEAVFDQIWHIPVDNYKISSGNLTKLKAQSYQSVYRLCTACAQQSQTTSEKKIGQKEVGQQAKRMIEKYLEKEAQQKVVSQKGEMLLITTSQIWADYEFVMKWAQRAFSYVHEHPAMIQDDDEPPTTEMMCVQCFHKSIYSHVQNNLSTLLLGEVARERADNHVDRMLMHKLLAMLVHMGMKNGNSGHLQVYQDDFEKPFLAETSIYYQAAAQRWLSEDGVHSYLYKVEQHLIKEEHRATSYLDSSSFKELTKTVEDKLLAEYKERVLFDDAAGMAALLETGKNVDLRRMYCLFKRIATGLDTMAEILREYIKKEGQKINHTFCAREADDTQYIESCIELHSKYTQLFAEWLENDNHLAEARKQAFIVFFNEKLPRAGKTSTTSGEKKEEHVTTAELLSLYCNHIIKGQKTTNEMDAVKLLESIVELASYITERDLFFEYYRRHMSRRLLAKNEDTYADQQLVSKLKERFGTAVMKLQGMLQDRAVASDFQDQFKAYCNEKKVRADFTVTVLTMGHWPTFKPIPLNPPEEVACNIKLFEEFYKSKTDSRKLKWVYSLGQATLRANFNTQSKDVICDTIQGCILLLFNAKEEWQLSEMSKLSSIPEGTIQSEVLPMLIGKYKILKKRGSESRSKLDRNDVLFVNGDFKDKMARISIPTLKAKMKEETDKEVESSVTEDRRLKMEACLVRIMKSSKRLRHVELKAKCIDQLKHQFLPDPRAIKRRIDDLISRGYMRRDDEDTNIFEYVA
eukprot:TRINITY_DN67797_c1_g2_i10.p1 TRINITY_DN67797_c1_g2~~TRINITY_DN67797_c1_g2_i10.p1  ORF type:complete len:766 (-),score=104.49 TRINITY_DN67797_c1_g2_i10:984-3281(-)